MAKEILYKYNPETDNFERVYKTVGSRITLWAKIGGLSFFFGIIIFLLVFYCFDSPTEENLREENRELRTQYKILNRRIENSQKVLERLIERDDNFYRVMMQMEPMSQSQRLAGLEKETRYSGGVDKLNDAALVSELDRRMNLMEKQIFSQVQSYEQLRERMGKEREKMSHIPSIMPINPSSFSLASGYGYRRDPISGHSKYHEGIDIAASTGTPVISTGDGIVELAERKAGAGNCIEINHDYNYKSTYSHLSEILVAPGQVIKRGQIIGKVGSSGVSTGPHLHYEVRFKGEAQNPVNYFFKDLGPKEFAEMMQKADNAGHLMD
ncbi:MAG: M23 family metallopeptidase [Muribaculaceae bacterium]|nr:M23 family metallopeptidase [Muribaculaceae bacterium]